MNEWLDYDFPTDIRSHMTGSWTRYRGQTQKWYGLTYLKDLSLCHACHVCSTVHVHSVTEALQSVKQGFTSRTARQKYLHLVCRCLMYYYGDEAEIDLEGHGEREFSDWCWMPLEQLPEEVTRLSVPALDRILTQRLSRQSDTAFQL